MRNTIEKAPNILFVVGVFRSGTSLLHTLLNQHSKVALMYEADFLDFPEALEWLRFKHDWSRRQDFFNQALSRHRLAIREPSSKVTAGIVPEDFYKLFGEGKGASIIGEKSTFYGSRLRRLAERYTESRFIVLWRDPTDVYRSIVRAARNDPFFRRRGVLNRLIYYEEQLISQVTQLPRMEFRICHVRYDDLVDKTRETCERLCDFMGLEFEERMLDLKRADLSVVHPGEHHTHLHGGKVERQQFVETKEILDRPVLEKLKRFDSRWRRLRHEFLGSEESAPGPEPGVVEYLQSRATGAALSAWDATKRLLIEFLPLVWLERYRQEKVRFSGRLAINRKQ